MNKIQLLVIALCIIFIIILIFMMKRDNSSNQSQNDNIIINNPYLLDNVPPNSNKDSETNKSLNNSIENEPSKKNFNKDLKKPLVIREKGKSMNNSIVNGLVKKPKHITGILQDNKLNNVKVHKIFNFDFLNLKSKNKDKYCGVDKNKKLVCNLDKKKYLATKAVGDKFKIFKDINNYCKNTINGIICNKDPKDASLFYITPSKKNNKYYNIIDSSTNKYCSSELSKNRIICDRDAEYAWEQYEIL